MIEDTIQRIEARLRGSDNLPEATRAELLTLLGTLKSELATLPASKAEEAEAIVRQADLSTERAIAPKRDAESMQGTLDQLAGSVHEFEDTHPKLVEIVNNMANTLAGLGI